MPDEGAVPAGWSRSRLGDHFLRVNRRNAAGVRRVLTASGDRGLIDQEEFFSKRVAGADLSTYLHIKNGEFAYNRSAMAGYPVGAVKRLERYDEGVVSSLYLCFGLRAAAPVDPDFAAHVLDSRVLEDELRPIVKVGARAHGLLNVSADDFMSVRFPTPPLPEQKKIAAILSSVDEAILATQLVLDQTRRVKEGLLQDLLTRGLPGHARFKPVSNWTTGRIPEVYSIPEHWDIVDICTLARLESGHTPSRKVPEWWDGDVQWLSLHDTKRMEAHVVSATSMTTTPAGIANSSARLLPAGTVALSRTATIGKCVILGREMATSQDFACYICGPRLYNKYLLHLFRYMGHVWDALSGGSTHKTVYMPIFEKLQVVLPPRDEQHKIADSLDSFDDHILSLQAVIDGHRVVKSGLLQDLLTGKVRVTP